MGTPLLKVGVHSTMITSESKVRRFHSDEGTIIICPHSRQLRSLLYSKSRTIRETFVPERQLWIRGGGSNCRSALFQF